MKPNNEYDNCHFVLCYRQQSAINYDDPIYDLHVLKAQKQTNINKKRDSKAPKTSLIPELKLIVPKDYNIVKFGFGPEKNRFLAFKRSKRLINNEGPSPLSIAYVPKIMDRYPMEDHPD